MVPAAESGEKRAQPEQYKGFLYIRCEKCGKARDFCLKYPSDKGLCQCGHETRLTGLRKMKVRCRCCGAAFDYQTNVQDEAFTADCFRCGAPVDLELHSGSNEYISI